jgi:competence protein ComEC
MCGTAVVMLAVRPGLLFDISFQLSFVAVAAIMAWFGPIYRLLRSRFRIINALWSTLILGFTASLATMPLVSHTFGLFSPAGVVLNPVVVSTAWLTITFSLAWIAAPVSWLEPMFRWLVGGPAWLQNRVVELAATVPGVTVEWTMPGWLMAATYLAMTALTVWFYSKPHRGADTSAIGNGL